MLILTLQQRLQQQILLQPPPHLQQTLQQPLQLLQPQVTLSRFYQLTGERESKRSISQLYNVPLSLSQSLIEMFFNRLS